MRTTLRLDADLLTAAKRAAVERGITLTARIEDALRRALAPQPGGRRGTVSRPTFPGDALQAGVDLGDPGSLLDVMDGPRAGP